MCDFDVTGSCDVISPDHFVRGFYYSSFRRCGLNFFVLQKDNKILVHNLSIPKKLEQSTNWNIFKKWGKDFTFGSGCTVHHIRCIQRDTLNLDICPVPTYVARWWHEKGGMELSDVTRGEDETVSILIGADYLHTFLKGRVERNGEIAFETDFGLVLSGPSHINPRLTTETNRRDISSTCHAS